MHRRNGLTPRNDARLNLVAEAMHLAVFSLDVEARMRAVQPAWESYTGQSWSQARDEGFLAAVYEQDRGLLRDRLRTGVRAQKPFEVTVRVWCAWAEQHRLCTLSAAPLAGPEGVEEWVLMLRDRACDAWLDDARAWQRAIEEEERVVQSLQTLVSGFSHVINNALQGVLLSTECAAREGRGATGWLPRIGEAVDRIALHCSGLHLLTGLSYESMESCDLAEQVRASQERVRARLPPLTELRCEAAPGCLVHANRALLGQAVEALLQNAVEALPEAGGSIHVSVASSHMDREDLAGARPYRNLRSGPWVYVEVCDTGSGIAPDLQPRVFQPLFSTKFKGRGLGLSTVLQLARRWGGLVMIRETETGGTCVRLLLPCERTCAGHVLVVAQEPAEQLLIRVALEGGAFTPLLARDVEEARELTRKRAARPDALVVDASADGALELARELRQERAGMGVVFLVANAVQARHCTAEGRIVPLRKPWRDRELVHALARARAFAAERAREPELAARPKWQA